MHDFRNPELTAAERAADLLGRLTVAEKCHMLTSRQPAVERLGLNELGVGTEIARGLVLRRPGQFSTVLPQPWGMAAMWDEELMEKLGRLAGDEVRICHEKGEPGANLYLFGPTVDMERDPRWGRNEEAYGEDPLLAARLNIAYTRGLSGLSADETALSAAGEAYLKTVPLLKHFFANNSEEGRTYTNSNVPPRLAKEYYLKVFRDIIRSGGAPGVMTAYNQINGIEALHHPAVFEARTEWGMELAVSDGGDFVQHVSTHRTFRDHAESISDILGQGADLMLDDNELVASAALKALERGTLTAEQIDSAVYAILLMRVRTGEFDAAGDVPFRHIPPEKLNSEEHQALNLQAACESVILLRNEAGTLPLDFDKLKKLAVVGPLANENFLDWYTGLSEQQISIQAALRKELGDDRIMYDSGLDLVAFRTQDGVWLVPDKDGRLHAAARSGQLSEAAPAEACFWLGDWGDGAVTLRHRDSELYLTAEELGQGKAGLVVRSKDVYGWFLRERFNLTRPNTRQTGLEEALELPGTDQVKLTTWRKQIVTATDNGIVAGLQAADGLEGRLIMYTLESGAERVAALAATADAVVVCGGSHPLINGRETEDRPGLTFPASHSRLAAAALAENPRTVLWSIAGYPYIWPDTLDDMPAIVHSSHLGPTLGEAVAAILSGRHNPSGRTPSTWYATEDDLPSILDYDIQKNKQTYLYYKGRVLYPFGYGLSYSRFSYSQLSTEQAEDGLHVHFHLTNTGERKGAEVAQLYLCPPARPFARPLQQLVDFVRVTLDPGESRKLSLFIPEEEMAIWLPEGERWAVPGGDYAFFAGSSSADRQLEGAFRWKSETLRGRDFRHKVSLLAADDYFGLEFLTDRQDYREYVLAEDWMSYACFNNVDAIGCRQIEIMASTPAVEAVVRFKNQRSGEEIGVAKISSTMALDRFCAVSIEIAEVTDLMDLVVEFDQMTAVKYLRFL